MSASFLFAIVTRLVNRETPFSGEPAKPKFGIAAIGHGNHSDHVRSRKHPNNLRPTSVGTLAAPSHAAGLERLTTEITKFRLLEFNPGLQGSDLHLQAGSWGTLLAVQVLFMEPLLYVNKFELGE